MTTCGVEGCEEHECMECGSADKGYDEFPCDSCSQIDNGTVCRFSPVEGE